MFNLDDDKSKTVSSAPALATTDEVKPVAEEPAIKNVVKAVKLKKSNGSIQRCVPILVRGK